MNALTRPLPGAGEACERLSQLKTLDEALTQMHALALGKAIVDMPEIADDLRDYHRALVFAAKDYLDPIIADAQVAADEAGAELEAAHIAAQRRELRAGSGVHFGRAGR